MGKIDRSDIYRTITEEYAGALLRWAVKKTGNRQDGEDLAQETLLQVFIYMAKGNEIRETENFIWKVAHHVWCNYLRKVRRVNDIMPLDEAVPDSRNIIDELAEADYLDSEISRMRRSIADLSRNQREAMILHYLEGLSVRQVTEKLGITESAVKKHLFDARNKIRGESRKMKTDTSYVYRPGKLALGATGVLSDEPDTARINDNLVRQNILLLCRSTSQKIDQLAELTGIPKPYLEPELDWLTRREFLTCENGKYSTIIPIRGQKHKQVTGEYYSSGEGKKLVDTVISYLNEKEVEIRNIGFYGSDFSLDRLMWPILMLFLGYFSRNSEIALRLKKRDEKEMRPDSGRYYVIGNDLSDSQDIDPDGYFKPEGWNDFYGIVSDNCATAGESDLYYWLGLYNYTAKEYHPDIINEDSGYARKAWHRLYCSLIESGFDTESLNGDEKEMLSTAVQKKFVIRENGSYRPNFIIFSEAQLNRIRDTIFKPLLVKITPVLEKAAEYFSAIHVKNMPKVTRGYVDYLTYLDLWNFGIYSFVSAAADELLYIPGTPEEGAPLTLVLVR